MNTTIIFLAYVFAGFVGFSAVALVMLLIKHKDVGKSQLMKAMCGFMLSSFLLGIIYFVTDCLDTLYGGHPYSAPVRLADMWLFIIMGYFWLKVIRTSVIEEGMEPDDPEKPVKVSVIVLLALAVPEYVFFMDPYYYVYPGWPRSYSYIVETIMFCFFIVFDIIYIFKAFCRIKNRGTCIYLLIVTAAVMANSIWNGVATLWVIKGSLTIETWNTQVNDPTAVLLLIINVMTLIFVFYHDFSPVYFRHREEGEKEELSDEERLEILAENRRLTKREKEVMVLAFEGCSYEEMAEQLFISKYTVKRHMHNIYEKLEISTRMDLVNQVKTTNGP
ncbi:MAG: helix-turn-helix transcriptional regulator [Eubacteriaceae bacterium]|nr:helix-turn-helix transcriptional regulator [Eubacteriaceae bacterium]